MNPSYNRGSCHLRPLRSLTVPMFVCGQAKLLGGVRETLWKCNGTWYVDAGTQLSLLKCIGMLLLPPETTLSETSSGLGEGAPYYTGRQIGDAPTGFGENINKGNKN